MWRLHLRCAMCRKMVASVYKVQYEHIKQDMMGCVYVFLSNSLGYVSAKN